MAELSVYVHNSGLFILELAAIPEFMWLSQFFSKQKGTISEGRVVIFVFNCKPVA